MGAKTQTSRWYILLLVIGELIVFSPALPSGYFLDDFQHVTHAWGAPLTAKGLAQAFHISAREIHDGWLPEWLAPMKVTYFRPLFILGLKLDRALGSGPWIAKLHGILLHVAMTIVYYYFVLELFPGRPFVAFISALFFGVHPHNVVTVAWVSGRMEIIPAIWMLVGLLAFLRYRRQRQLPWYLGSLACMALALLGKENGLIFPILAIGADLLILPQLRLGFRHYLPFLVLAILYLGVRFAALGGFPSPPPGFYYHPLTSLALLPVHLSKVVCTLGAIFFLAPYSYLVHAWMVSHSLACAVYSIPVVLATVWLFWRVRCRLALFCGLWIAVALAPSLPLISSTHYFYFALPAVIPLFALLRDRMAHPVQPLAQRPSLQRAVWVVIGFFLLHAVLVCSAITALFHLAQRPAEEVLARLPHPPAGAHLYFIDLPFAGFYLTPYLRLLYPQECLKGHILSFAPDFLQRSNSSVEWLNGQTLRTTAVGPAYFTDPITREFTFVRGPAPDERRVQADDYTIVAEGLELQPHGGVGVRSLRYEFHQSLAAVPRFFFLFTRTGVRLVEAPTTELSNPLASAAGTEAETHLSEPH